MDNEKSELNENLIGFVDGKPDYYPTGGMNFPPSKPHPQTPFNLAMYKMLENGRKGTRFVSY